MQHLSERQLLSGRHFQVQRNPTDPVTWLIVITECDWFPSGRRIKPLACGQKVGVFCPFTSLVTSWQLIKGTEAYYWLYNSNSNLCDIVILFSPFYFLNQEHMLLLFQLCKHNINKQKHVVSFHTGNVLGSIVTELCFLWYHFLLTVTYHEWHSLLWLVKEGEIDPKATRINVTFQYSKTSSCMDIIFYITCKCIALQIAL